MIILLTLIGRTALFDMERLYMLYISLYMYVPTCGNNLWPNAVAGAQKFFFFLLLINTMNDLLSMFRSLSLAISSQFHSSAYANT